MDVNEKANVFLRQYMDYQKQNYPSLVLTTREDRNGWWTDYRTDIGKVYINYKIQEDFVDLTFPKGADQYDKVKLVVEWARNHKIIGATVVKTKVSLMIRINVPKLDIMKGCENVDIDELNQCFEAIKELAGFANVIGLAESLAVKFSIEGAST